MKTKLLLIFNMYLQSSWLETTYTKQQQEAQRKIFKAASNVTINQYKINETDKPIKAGSTQLSSGFSVFFQNSQKKETSPEPIDPHAQNDNSKTHSVVNDITNSHDFKEQTNSNSNLLEFYELFLQKTENLEMHETFMEWFKSINNKNENIDMCVKLIHNIQTTNKLDEEKTKSFILLLIKYANKKLEKSTKDEIATSACELLGITIEKNLLDKPTPRTSLLNFEKKEKDWKKFIALLGLYPDAFCPSHKEESFIIKIIQILTIPKIISVICLCIAITILVLAIKGDIARLFKILENHLSTLFEQGERIEKKVQIMLDSSQLLIQAISGRNVSATQELENNLIKSNGAFGLLLGALNGNKTASEIVLDRLALDNPSFQNFIHKKMLLENSMLNSMLLGDIPTMMSALNNTLTEFTPTLTNQMLQQFGPLIGALMFSKSSSGSGLNRRLEILDIQENSLILNIWKQYKLLLNKVLSLCDNVKNKSKEEITICEEIKSIKQSTKISDK